MSRSSKILLGFFFVLLIVVFAEIGYYFFYQQKIRNKSLEISSITPSVKLGSQNEIKSESDFVDLISKAKNNQNTRIDGIAYLKKENPSLQCSSGPTCIEIDNRENFWSQYDALSTPINIDTSFLVRATLKVKSGLSGISLSGKINNSATSVWWKNISSIFIGLSDDGNRLYVDARNGTSADAFSLLDKEVKNISTLNIFFDKDGKYILITDEKYQTLTYLDINQITNNQFPNGLFPEGRIYLGAGIASNSYLGLLEFFITPIRN